MSMTKLRGILVFSSLLILAFSMNAVAGERGSITLFNEDATTTQSAVLAGFLAFIDGGANASVSVSNIMGSPAGSGFPGGEGSDDTGGLTFYLYNNDGSSAVFSTNDNPMVGTGTDDDGNLGPGGTYTVQLSEMIGTIGVGTFVGYMWVVADFDAVSGTFFNVFTAAGATQAFQMEPAAGGIPVATNGDDGGE